MIIQRKAYNLLNKWKEESQGKRALLIEGARRIGKSTIAQQFAKTEYRSFILIDFNTVSKRIKENFNNNLNNLDLFFQILSLEYNTQLFRRESLIIFDEIQKFPRAREAIKYLVADGRYDFIETGSLISIKENVADITIPSEERKLKMYPCDFEEFAIAHNETLLLDYICDCYSKRIPLDQAFHAKAMHLFREYLLVGGMPQSIVAYLENDYSFAASDRYKRDILEIYRDDIKKAARSYKSKVSALFENIPGYLSSHEKKVVLSSISSNRDVTFSQYDEPLYWLGDSMICNLCYKCNDPNIGFALTQDDSAVKCYLGDTGLLVSLAFSENSIANEQLYRNIMTGSLSLNEGMLYENAIAQMLTAKGKKLFFYTEYDRQKHRNGMEIDFLLSSEEKTKFKIFPIEVKSAKNYTTISLNKFRDKFGAKVGNAIIIHPKPLQKTEGILKIPPYMVWCMDCAGED